MADVETRRELLRKILTYGLPFVPLAIVSWVSNMGDRYIVGGYLGTDDAGLYATWYGLASRPFIMLSSITSGFARPILFQAESQGNPRKARRIFLLWMTLSAATSALGVIAFAVLGNWVKNVFLGPEFRLPATLAVFVWVGIGYALFNTSQIIETRLLSLAASRSLIVPALVGAVVNVGLNLLLIRKFGLVGAAQATAATFLLQLLLLCWNLRRSSGIIRKGVGAAG
jgi:O-antigen/teichoic acid export membrane protein